MSAYKAMRPDRRTPLVAQAQCAAIAGWVTRGDAPPAYRRTAPLLHTVYYGSRVTACHPIPKRCC
jgi:hypothetical protein